MNLYLAVTADRYELPLAVADSAGELARILGITSNQVSSAVCRQLSGKHRGYRIMRLQMNAKIGLALQREPDEPNLRDEPQDSSVLYHPERSYAMSYYHICPQCGAALDPGERCDCQTEEEADPTVTRDEERSNPHA